MRRSCRSCGCGSGERLGVSPRDADRFLWVVDFPLLERDEDAGRYVAVHHPFTAPRDEDLDRLEREPLAVRAQAYDLVLNGVELGGGSIRIHRPDVQARVLALLGMSEREAHDRFGFLLEALSYGAPPHGGLALGLDRLVMLLGGRRLDPRGDRVPEDAARDVSADRGADAGRSGAAARARASVWSTRIRRAARRAG